ncbi:MAG: glycosyltransferase [Clostridia bacterium]|nr:glycosyltransferase [Clostridia bacterium]MBP3681640.1 glycosyltransferase [Clostridia bacterium]
MPILLSIIVPVYNAESYLYTNILSIINQRKKSKEFEIILIDDGSLDNSAKICFELQQKYDNIKYFSQKNSGVSIARNKGIEYAKGKYICFLDSDDYVSEKYVETIISIAENKDFCILDNYIDENHKIYKEKTWLIDEFDKYIEKSRVMEWICENKINAPWDKIYLKEIIEKNNIRFKPGLNMGEDLIFNLEYINCCDKIFLSSEAICFHTINENGLCHRKTSLKHLEEFNTIYEDISNKIKKCERSDFYKEKINIAFLRNIANYAGKLYKSGYNKKQIKNIFGENEMIKNILNVKVRNLKDFSRKILLKNKMYKLCSILFNS